MRKLAVLMALFTLLIGSSAFALPLPLNFNGTVWQGTVTIQTPGSGGASEQAQIVITFENSDGANNDFISGTITAASGSTLPPGFPTEFSAVLGPFAASLVHMTATDAATTNPANAIIFGDAYKKGRLHTLGVHASILSGPLQGSSFFGFLHLQP